MGIREIIEKFRGGDSAKFKEFAQERAIERKWQEKQKSANERELERYLEEERQRHIKAELEWMRKKRDSEFKREHKVLAGKNIFKEKGVPFNLKNDNKMLQTDSTLMRGRYLFK